MRLATGAGGKAHAEAQRRRGEGKKGGRKEQGGRQGGKRANGRPNRGGKGGKMGEKGSAGGGRAELRLGGRFLSSRRAAVARRGAGEMLKRT